MKPPPPDWPRLSPSIYYDDARAAIAWLGEAFGFEPRLVIDGLGGRVEHSELTYGEAVVMVGSAGKDGSVSPGTAGGYTGGYFLYVDDADAHLARAVAAGATITREIATNDFGPEYWSDRSYGCNDPWGHRWFFSHRVRSRSAT